MSSALTPARPSMGLLNTPLGGTTIPNAATDANFPSADERMGAVWTKLVYGRVDQELTGLDAYNFIVPKLVVYLEGAADTTARQAEAIVLRRIRDAAVRSRLERPDFEGNEPAGPLSEDFAVRVAKQLVARGHSPQDVGVTGEGRVALTWSGPNQALMVTIGDDGIARFSSRISSGGEAWGTWGVAEMIHPACLAVLDGHF